MNPWLLPFPDPVERFHTLRSELRSDAAATNERRSDVAPLPLLDPVPAADRADPADPDAAAAVSATLHRIALALADPTDGERLLQTVAEQLAAVFAGAAAGILIAEPDERDVLRLRIGTGLLAAHRGEFFPAEGSFAGTALLASRIQHTAELRTDPRAYRPRGAGIEAGPAVAIPAAAGVDAPGAAVLFVARPPGGDPFSAADVERARPVLEVAAAAVGAAQRFDVGRRSREALEAWRREAALRRWSACYAAVAQADRKVVFEWNPATDSVVCGDSLTPVLGYAADEFGSTLEQWTAHLHPEDRERVVRQIAAAARRGAGWRVEARLAQPTGGYRPVVVRAGPLSGGAGRRMVGVIDAVAEHGGTAGPP